MSVQSSHPLTCLLVPPAHLCYIEMLMEPFGASQRSTTGSMCLQREADEQNMVPQCAGIGG